MLPINLILISKAVISDDHRYRPVLTHAAVETPRHGLTRKTSELTSLSNVTLDESVEKIKPRRFAKSQRTWFKTFRDVNWIDITEVDTVETVLENTFKIINA